MASTHLISSAEACFDPRIDCPMSFGTTIKSLAAVVVLAVFLFTGLLVYHVRVAPLDGIFEKIIPNPESAPDVAATDEMAQMLDASEMPDIDPGEKLFQKCHELLATGKIPEARERLNHLVTTYPTSSSASRSRQIIGEMNLDEILSSSHQEGKQIHVVKRGDSYFAIAEKYQTTLDMIIHLNQMMTLKNLQPGDELQVMPLNFRIMLDTSLSVISVWNVDQFIAEYPVKISGFERPLPKKKHPISGKAAELNGKRVLATSPTYRGAEKSILFGNPPIVIRGEVPKTANTSEESEPAAGIFLKPADMEELNLLVRKGNEIEIR